MDKLTENAKEKDNVSKTEIISAQVTSVIVCLTSSLVDVLTSHCRNPTYM